MWRIIFGFAILSFFYLTGKIIGNFLGSLIGVGDVGGVAFAMIGLLILTNSERWKEVDEKTKSGIGIASALFLPVVVAMIFQSDIAGAFAAGPVAILAGLTATITSLLLVNVISGMGDKE